MLRPSIVTDIYIRDILMVHTYRALPCVSLQLQIYRWWCAQRMHETSLYALVSRFASTLYITRGFVLEMHFVGLFFLRICDGLKGGVDDACCFFFSISFREKS